MKALLSVLGATLVAVTLSDPGATNAEERKVSTVFMFSGAGDAMAYTIDRTGANLPKQYAPWHFIRPVSTSGPTFSTGTDAAALREVQAKGFAVRVFSVTFEPGTPPGF